MVSHHSCLIYSRDIIDDGNDLRYNLPRCYIDRTCLRRSFMLSGSAIGLRKLNVENYQELVMRFWGLDVDTLKEFPYMFHNLAELDEISSKLAMEQLIAYRELAKQGASSTTRREAHRAVNTLLTGR